jgi:hypothetical protein
LAHRSGDIMHTDGIVLLAIDGAFLAGVFLMLARIGGRIDQLERRLERRSRVPRKKSASQKKD